MSSKRYRSAYAALYGDQGQLDLLSGGLSPNRVTSKPRRSSRFIEAGIQMRVVNWALERGLSILAIPNEGQRTRQQGHRAKLMGLRPGASDLFLAHCCHGYGGYWIELKRPGEKPRENQQAFLDEMRTRGYKAEWFNDWELARDSIITYLGMGAKLNGDRISKRG